MQKFVERYLEVETAVSRNKEKCVLAKKCAKDVQIAMSDIISLKENLDASQLHALEVIRKSMDDSFYAVIIRLDCNDPNPGKITFGSPSEYRDFLKGKTRKFVGIDKFP